MSLSTPGPWKAVVDRYTGTVSVYGNGTLIARLSTQNDRSKGNAPLIAAVPELVAFAQKVLSELVSIPETTASVAALTLLANRAREVLDQTEKEL